MLNKKDLKLQSIPIIRKFDLLSPSDHYGEVKNTSNSDEVQVGSHTWRGEVGVTYTRCKSNVVE